MLLVGHTVASRYDVGAPHHTVVVPPTLEPVVLERPVDQGRVAPSVLPHRHAAAPSGAPAQAVGPVLVVGGERSAVPVQLHQTEASVAGDGGVGGRGCSRAAAHSQPGR